MARQPRPLYRILAFLDPLLAGAALVVEGDHSLGRSSEEVEEAGSPIVIVLPTAKRFSAIGHYGNLLCATGIVPYIANISNQR